MISKWAVQPYDPKGYLTVHNFDPVIKESLNCLNELHSTKTLWDRDWETAHLQIITQPPS